MKHCSLPGRICLTSNHELLGKRRQIVTEYNGIYSPRNGIVAAYHTHKYGAEPLFWADIAFALWVGIATMVGGNAKNLRYIARGWICNDFTVSIMETAIAGDRTRLVVFKPGDETFLALLGTPNGVGGVYLLMQHKQALGLKTISRVVMGFDHGRFSPFLIFQVVDMPAPSHNLEDSVSVDNSSDVSSVTRSNVSSSSLSRNIWGGLSDLCHYRGSSRIAGSVDS